MSKASNKNHGLKAVPTGGRTKIENGPAGIDDVGVCPRCFGTGIEVVDGFGARTCECRRKDAHSLRLAKALIPKRYEKCHFNTFTHKLTASQRDALRFAQDFTQTFPAVDQGLLFTGPVGVGKTHLAVSIIKGLSERGFQCLFYEFGSLLKEIQDSYNPNTKASELTVLSPVLTADILVLDELGASKPTDWVRDTLGHIINTRYNHDLFTIFTTNYPDERASEAGETLEDRVGVRTRSRIFEMCRTVKIDGDDHRRSIGRAVSR